MPARVTRDKYGYRVTCPACRPVRSAFRPTHNGAHMLKALHNKVHR